MVETKENTDVKQIDMTDDQMDCLAMVDATISFASVYNNLVRLTKRYNTNKQADQLQRCISFIGGMYQAVADQLLDHQNVNDFLTQDQKQEIVDTLKLINPKEEQ